MNKIFIKTIKGIYHLIKKVVFSVYINTKLYEKKAQKSFYESSKFKRLDDTEITEKRICYRKKSVTKQFQTLLSMINIVLDDNQRFQHWIDTGLYFSKRYPLNGECPPDYSLVINNSINELLINFSQCKGRVGKSNYEVLLAVKNYIFRIIDAIDREIKQNSSESLTKTKFFFERMIDSKATSLEEALQRILFWSSIFWQMGHSLIGLGRLDKLLGKLYNPCDREETKFIINDFFKSLHQYYGFKSNDLLGDTGQLIILGGKEADGSYFCNELTYLFIECLKDFKTPDPKILLRVSNNMPDDLLEIAIDCISTGNGSPLLSNDEVVVPALIDFGYTEDDAYNYVTSACWEPFAYGKSIGNHNLGHVNFAKCFSNVLEKDDFLRYENFEELENAFKEEIRKSVKVLISGLEKIKWENNPLMSLFTVGCIENNKDISKGGAVHSDYGFLTVGLANAMDSLYNIKKYVFEEKIYGLFEIKSVLQNNYKDNDVIKNQLYNNTYYGHDSFEYIDFVNRITLVISEEIDGRKNPLGGKYCFGLSSFGYMDCGKNVPATADGRCAFEPLSVHISCKKGLPYTELVNFACKLNYRNFVYNGNLLDYIVSPDFINNNFDKFKKFLKISINNGFYQMQMNIVSSKVLIEARNNPNLFPNLIVRVWGFSAYFNDLPEEYKALLIKRALETENAV